MNPLKTPQALNERTMPDLHTSWSQTRNVELVRKSFLSQNYNTKQNSKMFPKVKVNVEQTPHSYTSSARTLPFMAHSGIWLIPNMLGLGLLCGWLTLYPLWCFGCSWILVRIYRSVRRMRSGNAFLSWKSGQETTDCWPSWDHAGHGLGFGSPMTSSSRHCRACRQLFFTQTMGPLGPQEVEHDG